MSRYHLSRTDEHISLLQSRAESRKCPCGEGNIIILRREIDMLSPRGFSTVYTCKTCKDPYDSEKDHKFDSPEIKRGREIAHLQEDVRDLEIELISLKDACITCKEMPMDIRKILKYSGRKICKNRVNICKEYYPTLLRINPLDIGKDG